MSTHDAGHSNRAKRRLVLRKIPGKASALPRVQPPAAGSAATEAAPPVPAVARQTTIQPPPTLTVPPAPPVQPMAPAPVDVAQARARIPSMHTSVPPVVASVVTPLGTVLDAPARRPASSSLKGVYMGTVLGLAIVGAVILGAQIAHRSSSPSSAAAPVMTETVAAPPPVAAAPAPREAD